MTATTDARAVVTAFFDKLGTVGDLDGWHALLSDDVVVHTPFSPTGDATRFAGRAEIEARFGAARRRMPSLRFYDLEVLATEDPQRFVATCRSEGSMANGAAYANTYCWLFTVVEGRITAWTEYFDPQQVLAVRRP